MSDKNQINITTAPPVRPPNNGSYDPELADLQKRRELLQIQQLEQQLALQEEALAVQAQKKAEGQALRYSTVQQLEKGKAQRAAAQAACFHLKENGKTAVVGQRDSHRTYHWLCQACQKEFTGNDPATGGLPMHLRPDPSTVGGPDF